MAEIVDVVHAEHRRIRHFRQALVEAERRCGDPDSDRVLASVWDRLAVLIEMNADAEEEICHLAVYGTGPLAVARIDDAEAELADIRAAVAEACLHPAGSPAWRRAAKAALTANRRHLDHRERGPLAGFARRASHSLREKLADQWLSFTAARMAELVPPEQRSGAACHYCEWPLTHRHRHVLDTQQLSIFCSCDVCHGLSHHIKIDPDVTRRPLLNGRRVNGRRVAAAGSKRGPGTTRTARPAAGRPAQRPAR
jgi:hypothetical protein